MRRHSKILENVVAAVETALRSVDGTTVIPNAMVRDRVTGELRQIDVLVSVPASGRTIRLALEVKDHDRPLAATAIDGAIGKLRDLDVDMLRIVSRSGFTRAARARAVALGIETLTMAEVALPAWWGPSVLEVHSFAFETVKVNFEYPDPEAVAGAFPLQGQQTGSVLLTLPSGEEKPLGAHIEDKVGTAIAQALQNGGRPESMEIRLDPAGCALELDGNALPLPDFITVIVRITINVELVPLIAFAGPVGPVITGVSITGGWQYTFQSRIAEGSQQIRMAIGPLHTQETVVEQRTMALDAPGQLTRWRVDHTEEEDQ
jgi:hypothetical protein